MAGAMSNNEPAKDVLKLATFETREGEVAVGVVRGEHVWPLKDCLTVDIDHPQAVDSMVGVIKAWPQLQGNIAPKGDGISLAEVTLLAPIPVPAGPVLCIGKNYEDHVKEVDTWKGPGITQPSAPKHPIVFTKTPQCVIGPGAAIRYPHGLSSSVDYEAELAVIIGKEGIGISQENAMEHVFGYTALNDVTARDVQKRHQQWFLGKSFDTFCPMGPWVVPSSDINGQDLHIQCWVDNELRQDGRTSQLIFSIPELIATISQGITLRSGDIIATGTSAGVGSGFTPPRHLQPGSTIRIRIEGIGDLVNKVE